MGKIWAGVRFKTGKHAEASVSIAGKGFRVFLPVTITQRTHAGKRENVSKPMFPGWLFSQFDPATDSYWSINSCRGVANRGLMVTAGGRPKPIPDAVIDRIMGDEAAALARVGEVTTGYEPGETFQIPVGKGVMTYSYIGEENGTVFASVFLLGKPHIVELEFSAVPPKNSIDARVA